MSGREFERGTVLRRVVAGEMSIRDATPLLAVSYRHARRLVARFRVHGARGLGHRARGRASNRTAPEAYRTQVLALVREHYAGPAERGAGQRFGPTLAAEHLWTDHGLLVPITTFTRWMRDADLWSRVPRALYTDWKNVYLRPPTVNETLRGEHPYTHFGRMCAKLGIQLIGAASPQAKGRVERGHGTHQDRLIKKLRLARIASVAAANAFVLERYLPEHNARFVVAPASPIDYHRARDRRRWPDAAVFCLESMRKVAADHVVQYEGRGLQLQPSARVPVKSTVLVREQRDSTITVVHIGRDGHQRTLPWTPAPPRAPKPIPLPRVAPRLPSTPRARQAPPPLTHPWHRASARAMDRWLHRQGITTTRPPIEILTPSHP